MRMKALQRKKEGKTLSGVKSTQHCTSLGALFIYYDPKRWNTQHLHSYTLNIEMENLM